GDQAVRKYDEIGGMADGVDAHITFTISGKDIEANGSLWLQLHKIAMHNTLIVGLYLYAQRNSTASANEALFVVFTLHPDRTACRTAGCIG
ncbi:MAG: hypothetical protein KA182_04230, partial [Propionivibrio sp.]|nr:hypothetical protein [Propionivibrio sp.]